MFTVKAVAVSAVLATIAGTASAPLSAAEQSGKVRSTSISTTAAITGWARMAFPAAGNDIQVSVAAHGHYSKENPNFPDRSWGAFRIYHRIEQPAGKAPVVNWGDARVDCLTTGGPVATVTGILVDAGPLWKNLVGTRMGLSFYVPGGKHNAGSIGLSGDTTRDGGPALAKCMAPAPSGAVIQGGYTLEGKHPE